MGGRSLLVYLMCLILASPLATIPTTQASQCHDDEYENSGSYEYEDNSSGGTHRGSYRDAGTSTTCSSSDSGGSVAHGPVHVKFADQYEYCVDRAGSRQFEGDSSSQSWNTTSRSESDYTYQHCHKYVVSEGTVGGASATAWTDESSTEGAEQGSGSYTYTDSTTNTTRNSHHRGAYAGEEVAVGSAFGTGTDLNGAAVAKCGQFRSWQTTESDSGTTSSDTFSWTCSADAVTSASEWSVGCGPRGSTWQGEQTYTAGCWAHSPGTAHHHVWCSSSFTWVSFGCRVTDHDAGTTMYIP